MMKNTYRDFDSPRTSTLPSRSVRIAPKKSRAERAGGFTLIELLVVISIIALLSTVVLAALGDSRAKARNTAKNSLVLEYVKALELYRSENQNSYPVTGATSVCFGYADGEPCYAGTRTGSTAIRNSVSAFLPSNFAHREPISSSLGNGNLNGVLYLCNGTSSCSSYTLSWVLERQITRCINNATQSIVDGNIRCDYVIN